MEKMEELGLQNPATLAAKLAGQTQNGDNWDLRGNIVWDVLDRYFSWMATDERRLLMSAVGTIVVDNSGTPTDYPSIVTAQDLIEVRPGMPVTVYTCEDPGAGCLTLSYDTVTDMKGFEPMIRDRLQEVADALNSGSTLNPGLVPWINQIGNPIYSVLTAKSDPTQRQAYIEGTSRLFAARLTRNYLSELTRGLQYGISQYKQQKPNWSGDVKPLYEKIRLIDQYLLDLESKIAQREANILKMTAGALQQSGSSARRR
jgi:hypothetical protein